MGGIDLDEMIKDIKRDARVARKYYTKMVDTGKSQLKEAKRVYKSERKNIRQQFRKCKKKAPRGKKSKKGWQNSSECKYFKEYFPKQKKLMESVTIRENIGKRRRGRRAARKQKRKEKKAARKQKRKEKCMKKPRCMLRQARRKARKRAKNTYRKTRDEVRGYKKELRKANFQLKILPKVIMMLKPDLMKALGKVDMANGDGGFLEGFPLDKLQSTDVLKLVMTYKLNDTLCPMLSILFDKIWQKIYKAVKPVKDAMKASLVTSVGTIPFVGGMLAAAVGVLVDLVWMALTTGIKSAFDMLRKKLQESLVKGIVGAVMATGLFTTQALQDPSQSAKLTAALSQTATNAQKKSESGMSSDFTTAAKNEAKTAEKQSKGAKAAVKAAGDEVAEEELEDDAEDAAQEDQEDEEDIDDDDD